MEFYNQFSYLLVALVSGALAGLGGLTSFLHPNFLTQLTSTYFSGEGFLLFATAMLLTRSLFEVVAAVCFKVAPVETIGLVEFSRSELTRGLVHSFLSAGLCAGLIWLIGPALATVRDSISPLVLAGSACFFAIIVVANLQKKPLITTGVLVAGGAIGLLLAKSGLLGFHLYSLLTGLYGIPIMLEALGEKTSENVEEIRQTHSEIEIRWFELIGGGAVGLFSSLFPAIGVTIFILLASSTVARERGAELACSIAASRNVGELAIAIYAGRARSGTTSELVRQLAQSPPGSVLVWFYFGAAMLVPALFLASWAGRRVSGLNLRKAALVGITLSILGVAWFEGVSGLVVLSAACLVGLVAVRFEINKTLLAISLLLPMLL